MRHIIFLPILILIFTACSGPKKSDPILQEAFKIHERSLEVAKDAGELLEGLSVDESTKKIFDLQLKEWGENVIEVPGFEHHHHHHGDGHHHHHHGPKLDLSPDDMLIVQKELLDSVMAIQNRIKALNSL